MLKDPASRSSARALFFSISLFPKKIVSLISKLEGPYKFWEQWKSMEWKTYKLPKKTPGELGGKLHRKCLEKLRVEDNTETIKSARKTPEELFGKL